jgi:16S rRNA (uracil1498-N3)-methyltransferase
LFQSALSASSIGAEMAALPRLFVPAETLSAQSPLRLLGAEHHYLSRVLRLSVGDEVLLLDGSAQVAKTRIVHVDGEALLLERLSVEDVPSHGEPVVTLYMALLKGERHDLVVQKATELGVRRIVTLLCKRCVPALGQQRAERRLERWQRIARAAAQQCRRPDLPEVTPPLPLREAVAQDGNDCRLMLYEGMAPPLRSLLDERLKVTRNVSLVVGPEGGLDAAELELLRGAGFLPVSLGPRVLRAETAALAALAVVLTA